MGGDIEFMTDTNGRPQLLFIDKGGKKVYVGSKLSDFIIVKKLGEGHFGSVSLVSSKITNKSFDFIWLSILEKISFIFNK